MNTLKSRFANISQQTLTNILLAAITLTLIAELFQFLPKRVMLRDIKTGESASVRDSSLTVNPFASSDLSAGGNLITFSTGELSIESGFEGPVMFYRNDNADDDNLFIDMILYSWHSHLIENPFSVLSLIYNSTVPTEFFRPTNPINMNQLFPTSAVDKGVFSVQWTGGNSVGMIGSTGGGGEMGFIIQKLFNIIPLDGKLIIGHDQTMRFDFKTDAAGTLRIAVVGWFGK